MGIYIQYIYKKKIVVLASEPVGGRSWATELPCIYYNMCVQYTRYTTKNIHRIYIDLSLCSITHIYMQKAVSSQFLAPPAECRVVRRRQLLNLKSLFLRNCLITFFLLWHGALLGRYQCTVQMWMVCGRSGLAHFPLMIDIQ